MKKVDVFISIYDLECQNIDIPVGTDIYFSKIGEQSSIRTSQNTIYSLSGQYKCHVKTDRTDYHVIEDKNDNGCPTGVECPVNRHNYGIVMSIEISKMDVLKQINPSEYLDFQLNLSLDI